jgi:3-oxoacyl-[acyl-carrier-protein] synthase II
MNDIDHLGRPTIVITGMGVISSLGQGQAENWKALTSGTSGIRAITRFPTEGLRTRIAGTVDFIPVEPFSSPALGQRMAELTVAEALAQAGINGNFPGPLVVAQPPIEVEWPQRLAIAAATGAPDSVTYSDLLRVANNGDFAADYRRFLFDSIGDHLADRFGTIGMPIATSTACASGGTAIVLGVEAIRRGETDAALIVGVESSINAESLIRFSLLSALSSRNEPPSAASRPFSKDREGFVMAEGSGALVLESLAHARARGAEILAVVEGFGENTDGFHRTRSSPDGKPIIACIRAALTDANLHPDDIGAINAHGTGTPENDKMEWIGTAAVFGDRAASLPISANKSMIGHTMSAAGAIEAIFTVLSIRNGLLPPTINYDIPDPALPLDCVPNVARRATVRHAISNSFGFGGQNLSLALGAPE